MALSTTCLWASLADLKPHLRLSSMDVADDVVLEARANEVTEELERETGRVWVSRSITETLSGTGTRVMYLRAYPVTAPLTTFTLDGVAVDTADYVLDADAGILTRRSGVWTAGVGNYAVSYTAGYARASLPASVVMLGVDLVRAKYLSWGTNVDVFQTQTLGGGGTLQPVVDWVSIRKRIDALRYEQRVPVA